MTGASVVQAEKRRAAHAAKPQNVPSKGWARFVTAAVRYNTGAVAYNKWPTTTGGLQHWAT